MKNNYSTFKDLTTKAGKVLASAVFAVVLLFPSVTKAANYALASANPAFPATNYCPNTTRDTIYKFTLTASLSTGNSFTGLNFTTNAGYVASSVTQFQLFRGGAVNNALASAGPAWTYQWTYLGVPVVNGSPAGAVYTNQSTSSLTINGLAAGSYSYRCNVGGACTITSNPVTVTVQPMSTWSPQIDAYVNANVGYYLQPGDPNNVTMCFRTSVDFSLWGGFPPVPSYTLQWKVNNTVVGSIPPVTYSTNF